MIEFFRKITTADIRNVLAVLIVVLAMGFVFMLLFKVVPPENKDIVNILGGGLMGGLSAVIGYYFGASKKESTSQNDAS